MSFSSFVTGEITDKVFDQITEINAVRRNYDSAADQRRTINLTPEVISKYIGRNSVKVDIGGGVLVEDKPPYYFYNNTGKMSDGATINLAMSVEYFRFPVNFFMVTPGDESIISGDIHDVINNVDAAESKRPSLWVYIDGLKIPDGEIMYYPTLSNVDVFVPLKYIDTVNGNKVIVEKRTYDTAKSAEYIHYYSKKGRSRITIELKNPNFNLIKNTKEENDAVVASLLRNVVIYSNRRLYNRSRSIVVDDAKRFTIYCDALAGGEVEIEYDPYVVFYFPSAHNLSSGEYPIYEIPETYLDSIHGPISRFSCAFYKDGLRCPNTEIEQKGRLHFQINERVSGDSKISFYLTDKDFVFDDEYILYGSDYYLYNFIGCGAVTNALQTTNSGNVFIDGGAHRVIQTTYDWSISKKLCEVEFNNTMLLSKERNYIKSAMTYFKNEDGKISNPTPIDIEDISWEPYVSPTPLKIQNPGKYFDTMHTNIIVLEISSYFGWDEVLNNDGKMYDRTKIDADAKYYETDTNDEPVTRLANLIHEERPHNVRDFLQQFGVENHSLTIDYDGVSEKNNFAISGEEDAFQDYSNKIYDICINNSHIPISEINFITDVFTRSFSIKGKHFVKGENDAYVTVYDKFPVEYVRCNKSNIYYGVGNNRFLTISSFQNVQSANDIIVLEKIDKNFNDGTSRTFLTGAESGYRLFKDVTVAYDPEYNVAVLDFIKVPDNEFLVYNKRFVNSYTYIKPKSEDTNMTMFPLYTGSTADPVPYVPGGKIFAYVGAEKLIEGVDYYLNTPENKDTAACSFMVIKRKVDPGTAIDIYITDIQSKTIFTHKGYIERTKYGLMYFSSLEFPFSLDYMNLYVNGKKMTKNDVDILSNKLIRVHSQKVPFYDIVLETCFTRDQSDLQPIINEYFDDNFERYLAFLFRGVTYDRNFTEDEEVPFNPDDIYDSFVDQVDSVDKKPNPRAGGDEWDPADDPDNPGIHNDGTAMGGKDIYASLIYNGVYVVAGGEGRVASATISSTQETIWTGYGAEVGTGTVHNDGSCANLSDIRCMCAAEQYLVFGTKSGEIIAYNTVSGQWLNKSSGIALTNLPWVADAAVNVVLYCEEYRQLYALGDKGTCATFDFASDEWIRPDVNIDVPVKAAAVTGVMGNIYAAAVFESTAGMTLLAFGEKGKAVSCRISNNAWCKPDGTALSDMKSTLNICSTGLERDYSTIYHCVDNYLNFIVLMGANGFVTYFDKTSYKFVNSGDSLCITNPDKTDGNHIFDGLNYKNRYLLTGKALGIVDSYDFNNHKWCFPGSDEGITSDGFYMSGRNIYTMVYYYEPFNLIITAGQDGKVATYKINEEVSPERYDLYKLNFLKWYNTPGNAIIQDIWDIPKEVADMFELYKENGEADDVVIAAGDTDLMEDITMNDPEPLTYPWSHDDRVKTIVHFIKSLPLKYETVIVYDKYGEPTPIKRPIGYTFSEIMKLYRESPEYNMLYEWDLIPLRPGDLVIGEDEDVDLTDYHNTKMLEFLWNKGRNIPKGRTLSEFTDGSMIRSPYSREVAIDDDGYIYWWYLNPKTRKWEAVSSVKKCWEIIEKYEKSGIITNIIVYAYRNIERKFYYSNTEAKAWLDPESTVPFKWQYCAIKDPRSGDYVSGALDDKLCDSKDVSRSLIEKDKKGKIHRHIYNNHMYLIEFYTEKKEFITKLLFQANCTIPTTLLTEYDKDSIAKIDVIFDENETRPNVLAITEGDSIEEAIKNRKTSFRLTHIDGHYSYHKYGQLKQVGYPYKIPTNGVTVGEILRSLKHREIEEYGFKYWAYEKDGKLVRYTDADEDLKIDRRDYSTTNYFFMAYAMCEIASFTDISGVDVTKIGNDQHFNAKYMYIVPNAENEVWHHVSTSVFIDTTVPDPDKRVKVAITVPDSDVARRYSELLISPNGGYDWESHSMEDISISRNETEDGVLEDVIEIPESYFGYGTNLVKFTYYEINSNPYIHVTPLFKYINIDVIVRPKDVTASDVFTPFGYIVQTGESFNKYAIRLKFFAHLKNNLLMDWTKEARIDSDINPVLFDEEQNMAVTLPNGEKKQFTVFAKNPDTSKLLLDKKVYINNRMNFAIFRYNYTDGFFRYYDTEDAPLDSYKTFESIKKIPSLCIGGTPDSFCLRKITDGTPYCTMLSVKDTDSKMYYLDKLVDTLYFNVDDSYRTTYGKIIDSYTAANKDFEKSVRGCDFSHFSINPETYAPITDEEKVQTILTAPEGQEMKKVGTLIKIYRVFKNSKLYYQVNRFDPFILEGYKTTIQSNGKLTSVSTGFICGYAIPEV